METNNPLKLNRPMIFLVAGVVGLWLFWPLVGMVVVWFSSVTGEQTNDMVWRLGNLGSFYETLGVLFVGLAFLAMLVLLWRQQSAAAAHAALADEDRKARERIAKLNGISARLAAYDKELQILESFPGRQTGAQVSGGTFELGAAFLTLNATDSTTGLFRFANLTDLTAGSPIRVSIGYDGGASTPGDGYTFTFLTVDTPFSTPPTFTPTSANWHEVSTANTISFRYSVVPEPSTAYVGALVCALVFLRRRSSRVR